MEGKRRTKYERLRMEERLESVHGWAQHGATMKELAGMLGVAESTIYAWRRAYPAFDEAVRKGAEEANGEILGAAFRLATGYTQTVQEPVKVRSAVRDEETGRWMQVDTVEIVSYDKTFPPDANMTRFLLVNRLPEHYRLKQEIDANGNVQLTDEDRALLRCVEERLRATDD